LLGSYLMAFKYLTNETLRSSTAPRARDMSTMGKIVLLIHELWVTPLSWEPFRRFYENLGYQVLAPAWPGIEGSVDQLRRNASALNGVGMGEVTARYAEIVRDLAEPPVIMGHGYGGVVTQLLVDQGLGAAGVAIASLPPKGILIQSLSTGRAMLPALANPFHYRGTVGLSFRQFWRSFCNTLSESEARRVYESQAVPAPCRPIFQVALANLTSGAATTVSFKNPNRAPLLFIGGGEDLIVPPSLVRRTFRNHRASPCVTEYREFPGRGHYIIAEQGWQEVADYALIWARAHARTRA
jgi:pimeloyl-ACP methyl ester carboxylesterase